MDRFEEDTEDENDENFAANDYPDEEASDIDSSDDEDERSMRMRYVAPDDNDTMLFQSR